MRMRWLCGTLGVAFLLSAPEFSFCQATPESGGSRPGATPNTNYRAVLNRYCVTCHSEKLKTAGLMLDKMDVERVTENAEVWEKVIRKLRTGAMPPAGMPRPDKPTYDSLAGYLETTLDKAAAAKPNPGRPGIHRLNRAEYANAIRELLALEIDSQALLPADDSGYGFDNIGDVLSVSPLLLDRYMSAARQISRLAIGDPTLRVPVTTYEVSQRRWQNDQASEDLPFWSRGGIAIRHYFPLDADYLVTIRLQKAGGTAVSGLGSPHELDVRLDDTRVKLFTLGGKPGAGSSNEGPKGEDVEKGLGVRLTVKAGMHLLGVGFLNEGTLRDGMLKPLLIGLQLEERSPTKGDPSVESVSVSGPQNVKGAGDTPSRRKIFACHPSDASKEETCAKQILSGLSRRAYRRPVNDHDLEILLGFYRDGRRDRSFDAAIGMALEGLLVSPEFLFRIERDPPKVAPGSVYHISDLDLASRLSFFLWSSPPDDLLLSLAERGQLKSKVLEQQVSRMLADPRSKALVDNFFGQWLGLRSVRDATPDPNVFPEFDESLRDAFEKETDLFLGSMLSEDHSVLDLLNANYTFANDRLARHYGIPNTYGSRFRRVTLTSESRMGLLGKGSILMLTSQPNRTSPVVRGKWVMENILGSPPPPPPPNVPPLAEGKEAERLTMRQRMEQHRANPVCASCHARMDPIGFAMENFDAIGEWRTTEAKAPIDASGVLPDGTKFQGTAELQKILLSRPEMFVDTVTEKLLTYALGRGVEYYDQPTIRSIMEHAAPNNYRWSALILGIVKSTPFQMRMSQEQRVVAGLR
jgi:mono/diheme cytochrome c family protein